jgi:hypothetical protein
MKYILIMLALAVNLSAKGAQYIYYTDPMAVPADVYDIDCDVKECKKGYNRLGDIYNNVAKCWCSKYKVFKARILNELHDSKGEPFWIVTNDCETAWIIYGADVIDIGDKK